MDYSPEEEGITSGEFFMTSRSYDLFKASSGLERKSFICLGITQPFFCKSEVRNTHGSLTI